MFDKLGIQKLIINGGSGEEKSSWQSIENGKLFFSMRVVGGETSYLIDLKEQNWAVT